LQKKLFGRLPNVCNPSNIYPQAMLEPELVAAESADNKTWERADAIRELVRGRMEVAGPVTVGELMGLLRLIAPPRSMPHCWRSKRKALFCAANFSPTRQNRNGGDRRLLARIHRLND